MTRSASTGAPPAQRLVVLGASNVQLGLPKILGVSRSFAAGPVDLFAALGHGRSFGRPSSIPGRTLPAITECRLWDDLAEKQTANTASLITDIGNDLLYGRKPERVAAWVAECVERLTTFGPVTIAGLPIGNLETLGEWRYRAFRTLFFPSLRLSLADLSSLAHELNERLIELASERHCYVEQSADWYGFDPIHYKLNERGAAWRSLLNKAMPCNGDSVPNRPKALELKRLESARLWLCAPEERRLLGLNRRAKQPCIVLRDGSRVSLY